jgi:hypothetical protein
MVAQKPEEKVRSLILSSELYHYAGEFKKAICYRKCAFTNQSDEQPGMVGIHQPVLQNNTDR